MSLYTSQGIVRVNCSIRCNDSGEAVPKATVFFVPDKDYSIKDRNRNYAIFVPQSCGPSGQSCGCPEHYGGCSEQSCGRSEQSCGCSGQSSGCKPHLCKNAIIRKYRPNEGIEIAMHEAAGRDCINIISTAAMKRVKVQVEVKATLKDGAIKKILKAAEAVACQAKRAEAACKIRKATAEAAASEDACEPARVAAKAAASEDACETAKAAAEAAKLVKVVNESNHCLKLTGITIPAQ